MAQINPPSFAHAPRRSSHKRKRSESAAPSSSFSVGEDRAINPLCYTPATLRQLQVAGHSDADLLPSTSVAQFPHRPLPPSPLPAQSRFSRPPSVAAAAAAAADDDGWETEGEGKDEGEGENESEDAATAARAARGRQQRAQHAHRVADRHLGALTAVAQRALEDGDLPRAARAFGLLVRSEVWGRPVDLRKGGCWAVGAEILMRQGEVADGGRGNSSPPPPPTTTTPRRWGRAANMPAVRDFFMALIHQYPYNRLHPRAVSALDFWPALLGCELYNAHAEHARALRRLEVAEAEEDEEEGNGDDDEGWSGGGPMDDDGDDGYHDDGGGGGGVRRAADRAERRRAARDQLRHEALRQMREVARSMDDLMVGPPYSASHELLRLRGMVALYMGDLAMPPPRSPPPPGRGGGDDDDDDDNDVELHEARTQRDTERERARRMFSKLLEGGGEVEDWIRDFVTRRGHDGEEDDDSSIINLGGLSSSLPIRGR
ncbi:hypothetical protein RB594_007427 [Gaeumannomyces avenae]